MKIIHRAHYNSLKERVEVALIGTTIALFADMVEVFSNVCRDGLSWIHAGVLIFLIIGGILAVSELIQTHKINFTQILMGLKLTKQKIRHNKEMNNKMGGYLKIS